MNYKDYQYKIDRQVVDVSGYGRLYTCGNPEKCNTCLNAWNYEHELPYIRTAERILLEGSIGIDVGAHTGTYAIALKDKIKTMYCFEPSKYAYEALCLNSGRYRNIIPIQLCCGSSFSEASDIPVVALDEFFDDDFVTQFLKIDTDGFECEILEGAKNLIERSDPLVLIVEIDSKVLAKNGKNAFDLFNALFDVGLDVSEFFERVKPSLKPNFFCNVFIQKYDGSVIADTDQAYYN
jgi:hypothetical protein